MDRSTRDRVIKWGMVGVLLLVAVGFAIKWYYGQLSRDDAGHVTGASNTSIDLAQVGDCIRELPPDSNEVSKVYFVPCTDPHEVEVVGQTTTTATGSTEASQVAFQECLDVYAAATGVTPDPNNLGYTPVILAPNKERPTYLCLIDWGERTTGPQATFQAAPSSGTPSGTPSPTAAAS